MPSEIATRIVAKLAIAQGVKFPSVAEAERVIDAELADVREALEPIKRFLEAYDRHAEGNPVRRGLSDDFYGIDGGDDVVGDDGHRGASLRISQLRTLVAALEVRP